MLDHIEEASRKAQVSVEIDRSALIMLARIAIKGKLGADWTKRQLDVLIDKMLREDTCATRMVYRFEPPDADEKRQAAAGK